MQCCVRLHTDSRRMFAFEQTSKTRTVGPMPQRGEGREPWNVPGSGGNKMGPLKYLSEATCQVSTFFPSEIQWANFCALYASANQRPERSGVWCRPRVETVDAMPNIAGFTIQRTAARGSASRRSSVGPWVLHVAPRCCTLSDTRGSLE